MGLFLILFVYVSCIPYRNNFNNNFNKGHFSDKKWKDFCLNIPLKVLTGMKNKKNDMAGVFKRAIVFAAKNNIDER